MLKMTTISFGLILYFVKVIDEHATGYLVGQTLTFISDRQKGLLDSIERAFPGSPHNYCVRHLYDNLHKQFKHPALRACLYRVAEAITEGITTLHLMR